MTKNYIILLSSLLLIEFNTFGQEHNQIDCVKEVIKNYTSHKVCNSTNDGRTPYYKACFENISVYKKIRYMNDDNDDLDSIDVYLYDSQIHKEFQLSITTAKQCHVSFSSSKPLMVINYLDERPEYYAASIDDYFWIYNLDSLSNGVLSKDSIYCKYCDDGHVVGDNLFFTCSNERDDFYNGFAWTDIYVAPFDHIEDSVAIARKFRIRAVSSDGKYILAQNENTIDKYSCAVIDVEHKKYQVLLGRDYHAHRVIYSDEERKFGFIYGEKVVYVDMPKTFPFDALEKKDIFWQSHLRQ